MIGDAFMIAVIGWAGAVVLLVAYGLVAAGRLAGDSAAFHLLNLIGGAALAANTAYHAAWPSASLNIVWFGIGAWALTRRAATRKEPAEDATRSPV
jgi:hypothetical protein